MTDLNPWIAAQNLCDKHVVKMVLETTQILSTVAYRYGGTYVPYKPTHKNHPCTLWAGETMGNWLWLLQHGLGIANAYLDRYGKVHNCHELLDKLYEQAMKGAGIPSTTDFDEITPFAQAMPEKYKHKDVVQAYRAYYIGEKAYFAKWRYCDSPEWWPVIG